MGSFRHQRSTSLLVILILCLCETEGGSGSETIHLRSGSEHSGDMSQNYFFYQRYEYARDCQEVQRGCSSLNRSGVYVIKPDGYPDPVEVYCDHDESSGGWTVIQRRVEGSTNFKRSWEEYKHGFGFLSNDFWLGNEILSHMTNQGVYELRMDMELSNGSSFYVTYDNLQISDEWDAYKILRVGGSSSSGTIVVNTDPTFQTSCPDTLEIKAYAAEATVATFSSPVCNDTGHIHVITSICSSADGLTSGSAFPIGTTTVTCTCTDSGSLTESCSFLVEVTVDSSCESGWLTYGDSRYCIYPDTVGWSEANSECINIDSHLARVESEAENQFLSENVDGIFWIGMRDVTEGVWRYEGSSVAPTYFKWDSGQPNNYGGNQDCAYINSNGDWHDDTCTNHHKFVCERS